MSMLRTVLLSLASAAMLFNLAMATNFTVGGPTGGWDTSTNLQAWASSQAFLVGDNLIFQYTPNHDVLEVSKADYDSCQNSNPTRAYSGGTTSIPLISPGTQYFICGTSGHCSQGMKVEIDTLAASAPPPASPPALSPGSTPASSPPTETPAFPPAFPPTETPISQPPATAGPTSSPSVPPTESPANSLPPNVFSPPPPPSSSSPKVKVMMDSTMGFAFVVTVLLFA